MMDVRDHPIIVDDMEHLLDGEAKCTWSMAGAPQCGAAAMYVALWDAECEHDRDELCLAHRDYLMSMVAVHGRLLACDEDDMDCYLLRTYAI